VASGAVPRLDQVVALLAARRPERGVFIIGITGSVAVGKTDFAGHLCRLLASLADHPHVEIACTDGFLFPNSILEERDLIHRKGFPETYDAKALRAALTGVRLGPTDFPGYSHLRFDIDPALTRRMKPPDILIIEGLGLGQDRNGASRVESLMDVLIYLEAHEGHIETWFADRFVGLAGAGRADPGSFYARFSSLAPAQIRAVAAEVWRGINLPNLRDHIAPLRRRADIVVRKGAGHEIESIVSHRRRRFGRSKTEGDRQSDTDRGRVRCETS
jgi:type I pantothenate kinase